MTDDLVERLREPLCCGRGCKEDEALVREAATALSEERDRAEGYREALEAIAFNAESWHAGEDGCRRALAVIAQWARNPEVIPEGIGLASPSETPPAGGSE